MFGIWEKRSNLLVECDFEVCFTQTQTYKKS